MNMEEVNSIEDMEKYIKWSIQTPGTPFDGWVMSEDEIRGMAQAIFNLATAGRLENV